MKEVSKKEYFDYISDKDLTLSIHGYYPYTSLWKDTENNVNAKHIASYPPGGIGPLVDTFFINY